MNEKRVTKNSIPDEKAIGRAILDALKSGRQKSEASLEKDTAAILGLSVAERTYRIGASKTTLYGNRFKKARAELHEAGLIEYPAKAKVRLTGDGKALAQEHALGASQPRHAEDARRKAAEPAADGLYRVPETPAARPADPNHAQTQTGSSFSFINLPQRSETAHRTFPILPLALAIIAVLLCLTRTLALLGILCGFASIAAFLIARKNQSATKAPKASIALSAASVFLGVSLVFAGTPSESTAKPDTASKAPDAAVSQKADSEPAEAKAEKAKLTLTVTAEEWPSDKTVPVVVTCTKGADAGKADRVDVKPGQRKTLAYEQGTYDFAIDTAALSDETTIYASDPVSYSFDGEESHTVKLTLDKDTDAMQRAQAEKEAAEKQAEEEEAAAAEAAAAEAAAAAAAAAASSTPDTGGYTVYITNTGEKYHASGCQYLKKSKIAISQSDAVAQGYTPCSKCNP